MGPLPGCSVLLGVGVETSRLLSRWHHTSDVLLRTPSLYDRGTLFAMGFTVLVFKRRPDVLRINQRADPHGLFRDSPPKEPPIFVFVVDPTLRVRGQPESPSQGDLGSSGHPWDLGRDTHSLHPSLRYSYHCRCLWILRG